MTITAEQLVERQRGIGSSDAAAILGMSPWRRPADVLAEKLGQVEPYEAGELAEIGTAFEPGIAALAARRLGVTLVEPERTYWHEAGFLCANIDRQVFAAVRGAPVVECKASWQAEGWGEAGTDQVPDIVMIQVVHQMVCCDAREAHVARIGLGRARGFYLYEIPWTPEVEGIAGILVTRLTAWWERHVIEREPLPDDAMPPSDDTLRRIIRTPGKVCALSNVEVALWQEAEQDAKEAKENAATQKAKVIARMGDAESGECGLGSLVVKKVPVKGYEVQPRVDTRFMWKAAKAGGDS